MVIRNSIIPFKGFAAINMFGVIVIRRETVVTEVMLNHEKIHTCQMNEFMFIFYYPVYLLEWFIRLFLKGNAYRNISFEREAYEHQRNLNYLKERNRFAFLKFITPNLTRLCMYDKLKSFVRTHDKIAHFIGGCFLSLSFSVLRKFMTDKLSFIVSFLILLIFIF